MKGKGLIKFFIIALIVVCLYQLMFTVATWRVESNAEEYAREKVWKDGMDPRATFQGTESERAVFIDSIHRQEQYFKKKYLDSVANEKVLDILVADFTYRQIKERQINLGLDLQGGMSVVLQVSLEEMVKAMANYSKDSTFVKAVNMARERLKTEPGKDFVTLFGEAFQQLDPNAKLAAIFATPENQDRISFNSTNEEVLAVIREQTNATVRSTFNIMRTRIDEFGVAQPNISLQESAGRIIIELPGIDDPARARKLLQSTAKLEFWETWENSEIFNSLVSANDVLRGILGLSDTAKKSEDDTSAFPASDTSMTNLLGTSATPDSPASLSADTSQLGITDTSFAEADTIADREKFPLFGSNSILLPATYQDEDGQVRLRPGSVIGYAYAGDRKKVMEYLSYEQVRALFPQNIKFLWGSKPFGNNLYELHAIKTQPNEDRAPLEGDVIVDARQDYDNTGRPDIDMVMNSEGARIWRRITAENAPKGNQPGRCVAIVMDDIVYSAPTVQSEIAGGRSQITGNFTIEEAKDLASVIKSGKLPAPAKIIQEELVGPSLGKESIKAGLFSLALGSVIVVLFMILYYTTSGIIADLALMTNLFFMVGVLASFGATVTLPGLAGIVLTLGMAVDANVIINERIREELAKGKGVRLAIADGYTASYSAIIDGNLTTMITGFILLFFGLGPVKGFATTLVIGLFTSFITAVLVSRLIVDYLLSKEKKIRFSSKISEGLFKNANFDFVGKRKIAYLISGAVTIAGLVSFFTKGFDLGVDFKGGRTYIVRFDKPVSSVDISTRLNDVFGSYPLVKTYGSPNQVSITTAYMIDSEDIATDSLVETTLYEGVKSFYDKEPTKEEFLKNYKMSSVKIGAAIADDIKQSAVLAAIYAIIGIFFYIVFRFRTWQYGLGAIVATVHDAVFVLSVFSVFGGMLPFSTEIDQNFIAALLTIIGYSLNDTVVVFDRVREYLGLHPTKDFKTVVNMAINSTLSRTVITGVTTLLVVIVMLFFGGEVLRGFCFALFIGILVGTYSSIFVATPIVVDLQKEKKPALAAKS
ncbi:MAG TPA: protein translocase subunit SecDF [Chitinophagales bacterium]|nr:protein translocase subunit SecDF [Chitinophagales bacterium]